MAGGWMLPVALPVELPEAHSPEEGVSHFRWGTVIDNFPFTVRLDGDSVPLGAEPDSLVDPLTLTVGTRVWVQLFARRVLVLGTTRARPSFQRTIITSKTSSWTISLTDEGNWFYYNSSSAGTITIPHTDDVAFPIGGFVDVAQWGTGTLTVQAATGVTFVVRGTGDSAGSYVLNGRYEVVRLLKTGTNTWIVYPIRPRDSDWVDVTIASGFVAYTEPAQVRRIGKQVTMRGGWGSTGITSSTTTSTFTNIGTIPEGYQPPTAVRVPIVNTVGAHMGRMVITGGTGVVRVDIIPNATVTLFTLTGYVGWTMD